MRSGKTDVRARLPGPPRHFHFQAAASLALLPAAIVFAVSFVVIPRTSASSLDADVHTGSVSIVDAYNRSEPLTHGHSATQFSVRLPEGAMCPGDSANDQWRVESFIVPSTDDPDQIAYGAIGPEPVGDGRYALFGVDTVPYVFQLTYRNAGPGQPGAIPTMPAFSFAVVAGEMIPSGAYYLGVACTDLHGKTGRYWDAEVVLNESSSDKPGDLTWRLGNIPETVFRSDHESNRWTTFAFGGVGVATIASLGWLVSRRRMRRHPTILSKEHP